MKLPTIALALVLLGATMVSTETTDTQACAAAFRTSKWSTAITDCAKEAKDHAADATLETGFMHYVDLDAQGMNYGMLGYAYNKLGNAAQSKSFYAQAKVLFQSVLQGTKDPTLVGLANQGIQLINTPPKR